MVASINLSCQASTFFIFREDQYHLPHNFAHKKAQVHSVLPWRLEQHCTHHTVDNSFPEDFLYILEPHFIKLPKTVVSGYAFSFHSSGPATTKSIELDLWPWYFSHSDWVTVKLETLDTIPNQLTFSDGTQAPQMTFSDKFVFLFLTFTIKYLCSMKGLFSFSMTLQSQDNKQVRNQKFDLSFPDLTSFCQKNKTNVVLHPEAVSEKCFDANSRSRFQSLYWKKLPDVRKSLNSSSLANMIDP